MDAQIRDDRCIRPARRCRWLRGSGTAGLSRRWRTAAVQQRPVSWVTENGIDWVANEKGDILVEAFAYQQFKHIWPVAGGWDAALGQPMIVPEDSALVHSDDGLHWHALAPVPGTATGDAPAENVGGVGTPDGQRIIWTFNEADNMVRLWRSEGTAWTVLGDLGPEVSITASLGPSGRASRGSSAPARGATRVRHACGSPLTVSTSRRPRSRVDPRRARGDHLARAVARRLSRACGCLRLHAGVSLVEC